MRHAFSLLIMTAFLFCSNQLHAAELYEEQMLYSEPNIHALGVGVVPKGEVAVMARRGFWVKVKAGQMVGWIKLSDIKMDQAFAWMPPIDTLRDTGRMVEESH